MDAPPQIGSERGRYGGSALDPEVVSQMLGRRRDDDPLEQRTAWCGAEIGISPRDLRSILSGQAYLRERSHLFQDDLPSSS